ncbi:MAG: hypothetical protein ACI8P0_004504 [Planctomycetaceae bacterium]|jgi:hypothetical protein
MVMNRTDSKPDNKPQASVHELGKVTVFYVPSHKLDHPKHARNSLTARQDIHEFLMGRYNAYTQTPTPVRGYWAAPDGEVFHDVMERFEVSFGSESEFDRLIEFLAELCERLNEQAIYVTRGERSFLVQRSPHRS